MATNPMKKRAQNAFLIGIVIGLIFTVLVGFILYKKYSDTKKEYEEYVAAQTAKQVTVMVAKNEIKSGTQVTKDDFKTSTVIIDMSKADVAENCYKNEKEMFQQASESGDSKEVYEIELYSRLDIPKGAVITKNLLVEKGKEITNDTRIKEYNTFVLPSQLNVGDIIDVRLAMPSGQDFVVLSKKEVLKADETTVWLKVNEAEILLMNSAMVEAWTIKGTKLYAIQYVEAGLQESAIVTYQGNAEVMDLINKNPNIVDEAAENLAIDLNNSDGRRFREEYIDTLLTQYIDDRDSAAATGFSNETSEIKTHRKQYIDSLNKSSSSKTSSSTSSSSKK